MRAPTSSFALFLFFLLGLLIIQSSFLIGQTATITNIQVSQRTDGSGYVDIYYNLQGTGNYYSIIVQASFNNGSTFSSISSGYLSGNVASVTPGNSRHILWNGLVSNNNTYSTQTKIKLIADDGTTSYTDNFNRTTLGSTWTIRFGNWTIDNNKLKHVGDGTFNSNFVIFNTPIYWSHYTVECKSMWISGGFFEDGPAVGYSVWPTPVTNGNYVDEFVFGYLSSYNCCGITPRASIEQYVRNGSSSTNTGYNNYNLGFSIQQNQWYNLKIDVNLQSGTNYLISFYVNGILYVSHQLSLSGNSVALGGWKGQYGQVVYFDDFVVTKIN